MVGVGETGDRSWIGYGPNIGRKQGEGSRVILHQLLSEQSNSYDL